MWLHFDRFSSVIIDAYINNSCFSYDLFQSVSGLYARENTLTILLVERCHAFRPPEKTSYFEFGLNVYSTIVHSWILQITI